MLLQVAFALVVLAAVALGALSWRLSRGPLELPWLAQRLAAAVNTDTPAHLSLGGAALAWEGFREGVDQPLDIRVTDVTASDASGAPLAAIPRAKVSLSVGWLLLGRLVPRAIEIEGARLRVLRAADGDVTLDLGSLAEVIDPAGAEPAATGAATSLLRELSRPPAGDRAIGRRSRWSQLERIRIRDATVGVVDRQLGMTWKIPALGADLRRRAQGGVEGQADASVTVGDQTATLTATAELRGDNHRTHVAARLGRFVPARLAPLVPGATTLAALDAPVGLAASVDLDPDLRLVHFTADADVTAGTLHVGRGTMPLLDAALHAEGTPAEMRVELARLVTAPRADGPRTQLRAHADLSRGADGAIRATATLDLDQVAFSDLPGLWPEGTGDNGARAWITRNVTAGTARNGHFEATLTAPADLSDATLTHVAGGLDGHDVTVHWLRPVPPIEHVEARLTVPTPDTLVIAITGGRQAGPIQSGLQIHAGRVTIAGLNDPDQFADIEGDIVGPVPDLLALLRHPKVRLLDRSPLKLNDAAGQIAGKVTLTRLPLRDDVAFDGLQIRAEAHVTGLRLGGIAAGRDLTDGDFTLSASPDGLRANGGADIAGIPAEMRLDMDFRAGPPDSVSQKIAVSGNLDARQLATLGVDARGIVTGPLAVTADLATRRDGQGDVTIAADLARAAIRVDRLNFVKPAGQAAKLSARVVLAGERVAAIEALHVEGEALRIDAAADFVAGEPALLRLQRIILGGTDARGEIRLPSRLGGPWAVTLTGPSLDASKAFHEIAAPADTTTTDRRVAMPWLLDASFDRVILGPGRAATRVAAHAENDGQAVRRASLTGATPGGTPFQVGVEPQAGGRRLSGSTGDAGGLLRMFDVIDTMQGGRMTVTGRFDDSRPDHPLSGTAELLDFRIRNAPVLARLLQAMTLYGLVEAAQGPGLGFSRLVAPFRLASEILTLSDARAYSASLGMTAKGQIDLARQTVDMQGTIVPAYFFNSLLGNIPLVGKLFSPERGGGVFSATYAVRGRLTNPEVSINPLAALTPGFLRGLFGVFDGAGASGH